MNPHLPGQGTVPCCLHAVRFRIQSTPSHLGHKQIGLTQKFIIGLGRH